jgi:predicted nucleotidyltransferase
MDNSRPEPRGDGTIEAMASSVPTNGLLGGIDRERVAEICGRYGVVELLVFGSRARGDAGSGSDVDLLYTLAPGHHLGFSVHRLEDELAEAFECPVDLVSKSALHRLMRSDVLADSQVLYAA